jgi:uncharacterized protein YdhG (YjbR/CyaY superfamily)
MKKYSTIDEYISAFPADVQLTLRKLRKTIATAAPQATEAISYGIPTYKMHGNLVHFGAFQDHIGFFPTSSGVSAFATQLSQYDCSKGTVRFPLSKALPYDLVTKIVKFRVKQVSEKNKK